MARTGISAAIRIDVDESYIFRQSLLIEVNFTLFSMS